MGTRNLTCVVMDDKFVVSQYCQWDGYPEGQGATIVDFLTKKMDMEKFTKALKELKYPTKKQIVAKIKKVTGVDCAANGGWINLDESNKIKEAFPHFDRDMGAKVLEAIQDGTVKEVELETDFVNDSLFCEWAYVIDMDNQILEVYQGFVQEPLDKSERFYKAEPNESGYYPVKLRAKYKFKSAGKLLEDAKKWAKEDE